jgi:hypothetical protein
MNLFTIYKTSTGEILYNTSTVAEIDELGLQEGEGAVEGHYQSNEYKILEEVAVLRTDNVLEMLRIKRGQLLSESDWTQTLDTPLTDSKKAEWATYRQSLRDLPSNNSDATSIDDVTFPTEPA